MFLDKIDNLSLLDPDNMLGHIDAQPDHYAAAWKHGQSMEMPDLNGIRQVVIAGMGGSAIGGDLLASLAASTSRISIQVVRGYDLPAYAHGSETLLVASSFSGNTEETLSVYNQAQERGVRILAITTGGKLADRVTNDGHTLWQFQDTIGQPRAAIGWSLGLLLTLADRARWIRSLQTDFKDSLTNLKKYQSHYRVDVPAEDNPAKRQAGQFMGRFPVLVGGGVFETVARRWKTQLNENAKVWALYDPMPEMNHNTVVGIEQPSDALTKLCVVFITSREYDHPRVAERHSLTFKLFLQNGIMVDKFRPRGSSLLAQTLHAILYGDYVSYYAAIATQTDPTVIDPIVQLKQALAASQK